MKQQLCALVLCVLSAAVYFYFSSQFNVFTDEGDYISVDKIYESSSIKKETRTRYRSGGGKYKRMRPYKVTYTSLVLKMTDGTLWYVNEDYGMYWPVLKDSTNKGKTFTLLYNPNKKQSPVEVAINGATIYDISILEKQQETIEKELKPIQDNTKKMLVIALISVGFMIFIRLKVNKGKLNS